MQAEQKRRFDAWKKLENPKYQPTDDSMQDRRDWKVWSAAISTSPHEQQSECERFEAWYFDKWCHPISKDGRGGYNFLDDRNHWLVWQARAALSHPSPQGLLSVESLKALEKYLMHQPLSNGLLERLHDVRCSLKGWPPAHQTPESQP